MTPLISVCQSCHYFFVSNTDDILEESEQASDLETLLRQEREREKAQHQKDLADEVGL